MRIEYHRTLIGDKHRNEAFYRALGRVITAGETSVADIGAGTGLLGLMASRLGAREVFLYETAEVAGVAEAILELNKARGCQVMACHSTEMLDPPKVDVVVSETLGNYAFEENIIATLVDARERFLEPGGVIIPAQVTQFVAPVISPRIDRELRVWDEVGFGIDMSVAQRLSFNNVYVRCLETEELMEPEGVIWDHVEFSSVTSSARSGEATWRITEAQRVYGLCVWWSAHLVGDIAIHTGPGGPSSHWEQLYFPILEPMDVGAGDKLVASIQSRSSEEEGTHLAWSVSQFDGSGACVARFEMDLDRGFLP